MNFAEKIAIKFAKKLIIKKLDSEKDSIIKLINDKVDLPEMDEAKEKILFDNLYKALTDIVKTYLN